MKILLINPPLLGGYREFDLYLPPIGLGYIAAVLEQGGHEVKILDLSMDKWRDEEINNYDLVGISSLTPTYPRALKIAKRIRSLNPTLPLVIGGPHASFLDNHAFDVFDYAVRKEGEYTFLELVNSIERGFDVKDILGITYKDNGKVIYNPERPFIKNLDEIPFPARHLFKHKVKGCMKIRGEFVTSVVSSRGCPFACSFCSTSMLTGMLWRARSPVNIVKELEEIRNKYNYKAVTFVDDNFTLNPARVVKISDEIKERGLKMKLSCMSRVDTILKNPEMVKKMADSGCEAVFLGIESANQVVLDNYNKRITVAMVKKAFKILRENGIGIVGSFIIGNLMETKEMIMKTINFAKELDPDTAQFSILTPFPGTKLWNEVKDKIINRNLEFYDGAHAVMKTKFLEPEELEELLSKAYREFYLRPRRILRELRYMFRTGDIEALRYLWKFMMEKIAY